eukprot:scaffold4705_cov108-Cylindrotheca_fusiformis.AAC.3
MSSSPTFFHCVSLWSLLVFLLAFSILAGLVAGAVPTSVARAREEANQANDNTCPNPPPPVLECGVFMAPSTLGNNSNLGIFTGIPLQQGQVVNYPEIAIPLLFRNFDEHPPNSLGDGTLWDRYIWGGHVANIDPIDDFNRDLERAVFVPGVGCTVNSMLDLYNIDSTSGSIYDTAKVPRYHPAAGSFSPYHSSKTTATRDVPVGSELLANYGDGWIPAIPDVAVTFDKHFDKADEFLQDYQQWVEQLVANYVDEVTPELLERLWKVATTLHPSRDFSVLPRELDWHQYLTTSTKSFPTSREYWRSKTVRSMEWLQEHGKCQDHLKPGLSTIPLAGRGAFASRDLPKGAIVGYAPLIHIGEAANELLQYTYDTPYHDGNYTKPELVINYSFSHPKSTLLLTPYGAGVNFINHASPPLKPNVRIQWPTEELLAHKPEWLIHDVAYLRDTIGKIGLSFDYVALRDIAKGEEILMDYGADWQRAWEEHVATYEVPADAKTYVHSSEYHLRELKTPQEVEVDPYPSNLHTLCKVSYTKNKQDGKLYFMNVLRSDGRFVPCEVLERHHESTTYTVRLTIPSTNQTLVVHQVTRPGGIELFDKAFSQDMHLPQSFRHSISIPDDMFPESWKNK